jgi:hypothetical protein
MAAAAEGSQAVYVFVRQGGIWTEQAKLTASDNGQGFGRSVAINGDRILVGAPWDEGSGEIAGAAYLFVREGTNWIEQDKWLPSDARDWMYFGQSVAINGEQAVVGAHGSNGSPMGGSAYPYAHDGTAWNEQLKLTSPDPADGNVFGVSVALSGGVALIGSPGDDEACPGNPLCNSGAAYVFPFEGAPNVIIRAIEQPASEAGLDSGQFRIFRSDNTDSPLRVYYSVTGTATPNVDYTALRGFATIPAGKRVALFRIMPIDDAVAEPAETVRVDLLDDPGYSVVSPSHAEMSIIDND